MTEDVMRVILAMARNANRNAELLERLTLENARVLDCVMNSLTRIEKRLETKERWGKESGTDSECLGDG